MRISRLWLKVFLFTLFIVGGCSLAISLYSIPLVRRITLGMEEKYAFSQVDRVYGLVQEKYLEIEDYRERALASRKRELEHITSVVGGYLEEEYRAAEAGRCSTAEAQQRAIDYCRNFRYGHDDYIWISNFDSVLISHPDPRLHGTDFSEVVDVRGNGIVPPMVKVARAEGAGFTSYWWNRLGEEQPSEKLTYSRLFEPWSWVYGTGVYVDDVGKEVARKQEELVEQLNVVMNEVELGDTGYMYVFDASVNLIVHWDKARLQPVLRELRNPLTGRILVHEIMEAAHSKEKVVRYLWDHPSDPGNFTHEKITWVRYFPGFDWYIASSVYTDELYATSWRLVKRIGLISFVIFAVSLLLAFVLVRRMLRPLERLSNTVNQVKTGNLDVRSGVTGRDEIGMLGAEFDNMVGQLQEHLETLDAKVREKTSEVSEQYARLEAANRKIVDSIEYARTIQAAILPRKKEIERCFGDHFILWKPKDMLGGDLYWFETREGNTLLAVMDCTGHGVPGAVMTMIAATSLARAVDELGGSDPAGILASVNCRVQHALNQHRPGSQSDDGLDLALCLIDREGENVTFSGARLGIYVARGECVDEIRGDRQSLGYKSSRLDYVYRNHVIPLDPNGTEFYLATDGLIEQPGGPRGFPFGRSRFKDFIVHRPQGPMVEKKNALLKQWLEYKGDSPQRDDFTVIGFTL